MKSCKYISFGLMLLLGHLLPNSLSSSAIPLDTDTPLMPTRTMREETIYMIRCMEELHLEHKNISLLDNKTILNDYLTNLDQGKMIFLQRDVDAIAQKFVQTLDVFVSGGSLIPAFNIFEKFRTLFMERMNWVFSRLEQPWDFDADETIYPNRKDCNWPQTAEEADSLWEKRLKFEILNEAFALAKTQKYTNAEQVEAVGIDTDESTMTKVDDGTDDNPGIVCVEENVRNSHDTEEILVDDSLSRTMTQNIQETTTIRKYSKQDVLSRIDEAIANIQRRYESWIRSYKTVDSWLVQEMFLNSISKMYDPHSSFLSKDSYEDLTIHIRNALIGIGAELKDENGFCIITKTIPGGPAQRSGEIKPGDKIVAVAQGDDGEFVDIIGLRLYKTVKLLRGPKDTVVRVKLETVNGDSKEVRLIRDAVKFNDARASAKYFELEDNGHITKLGVIKLPSFYGDVNVKNSDCVYADRDVEMLISALKDKNIDGLIIDLRQNGGGLLNQAVSIAGLFIVTGPVVQVKDTFGRIDRLDDKDDKIVWKGPLAVLSSAMSASASEILIGALRDHKRALIVGAEATYGKGSVQVALDMNLFKSLSGNKDLGAAYVTVQKWYLPTGISTQLQGVPADIKLRSLEDCLCQREASYPHALACDSIAGVEFDYSGQYEQDKEICFVDDDLVNKLSERSQARQETLAEFDLWRRRLEHFDGIVNKKEFPLSISAKLDGKQQEEQFVSELDHQVEDLRLSCDYRSDNIELPDAAHDETVSDEKSKKDIDDIAIFDINLREGLRIVRDWVELLPK